MTRGGEIQHLWAPWRQAYIASHGERPRGCIFCIAKRARDDRQPQVLYRGRTVFVLLNRYPYTPGHLMVAPYRHIRRLSQLTAAEAAEALLTMGRMESVLVRTFHSDAFNAGANVGRPAGAGIPGHLHFHLVPRWSGDTNFMSVVSRTRVMSDSLDAVYSRLKPLMPANHRARS